ncbi:phage tail protein [Thalassolituus oleivorans]|uniref:phage tail protein n=1 Tax=Thalassolituus oleivorans TaxID=187493 RepID=UPI0023F27789|nr:phage tail protein [Thalassolituus oleivorans]
MLACLGLFIFDLKTAPLTERSRNTDWRHARPAVIGQRAPSTYIGPGQDTVTLTGVIAHDIAGTELSLDVLRKMGDTGEPYVLVYGTGQVVGMFEIDSISETSTAFFPNGKPRRIEFNISLTRVSNEKADLISLVTSPLSLIS